MVGFLAAFKDWRDRRQILREIRQETVDRNERMRFHVRDVLTLAMGALERDDPAQAGRAWDRLMRDHPDLARASPLAFPLLLRLRRLDEAQALLEAGRKAHPNDPKYAIGLGQLAMLRGDMDEAMQRWELVRKKFPGVVDGYTQGAAALSAKGRDQEAEALAMKAVQRFPDDMLGMLELSRLAMKREDWETALKWLRPIKDDFGYVGGWTSSANCLAQLGRFDEADELMSQARLRFGTDPSPLMQYCRTAEARGDRDEAIRRWHMVLQRFPLITHIYYDAAQAFERLGAPEAAEAALKSAVERFDQEDRPLVELARYYHFSRHDAVAAAATWATIREIFPSIQEAYTRGADALREAGRPEEAEAVLAAYHARFDADQGSAAP